MEIPSEVLVHSEQLGVKGGRGTLLRVGEGYYELNLKFGDNVHRVLLPIGGTALIAAEPEPVLRSDIEIER
ncbi:MAG TPA: hypothetical protein VMT16_15940 [Thermoanaerobaculia bacterium]|nr:hypothetical protein [Thermoanaerobaculia bacterium]